MGLGVFLIAKKKPPTPRVGAMPAEATRPGEIRQVKARREVSAPTVGNGEDRRRGVAPSENLMETTRGFRDSRSRQTGPRWACRVDVAPGCGAKARRPSLLHKPM